MAGFEDLIRGALSKQADPNPQAREKVYESARGALSRMLDGNSGLTPEVAKAQREKLENAITAIEAEYAKPAPAAPPDPAPAPPPPPPATSVPVPPAPPVPTPPKAPEPEAARPASPPPPTPTPPAVPSPTAPSSPAPKAPEVSASPQQTTPQASPPPSVPTAPVATPPSPSGRVDPPSLSAASPSPSAPSGQRREPTMGAASPGLAAERIPEPPVRLDDDYDDLPDGYLGNTRREKKPFARLLLWTIILTGIGVAIWWGVTNVPRMLQELQSNVPDSNLTLTTGPATSGAQDEEGWLTVFAPQDDAQNVVTKGAGAAELQQDGNRPVMRLASPNASLENNLLIRLPRGTMQDLRGKSATFELVIRSGGDEEQSFAIFCDFGALGDCGRKRFSAGSNPKPELFDVLINDAALAPGEDAYISINTDFEGNGRPLDIYSIRVRESG